jgi:hypothetical protein
MGLTKTTAQRRQRKTISISMTSAWLCGALQRTVIGLMFCSLLQTAQPAYFETPRPAVCSTCVIASDCLINGQCGAAR